MEENRNEKFEIEGRNAVMEAFRSGKTVDKLYLQDGCHDGSINSIVREAKKQETIINYVSKEKLNQMSSTGKHQGVTALRFGIITPCAPHRFAVRTIAPRL